MSWFVGAPSAAHQMPAIENRQRKASVMLLCGLPGSGKSSLASAIVPTFSRKVAENDSKLHSISSSAKESKKHNNSKNNYDRIVLINYDDIVNGIANDEREKGQSGPQQNFIENDPALPLLEGDQSSQFDDTDLQAWRDCRNIALRRLKHELFCHFTMPLLTEQNNETHLTSDLLIVLDDNFHLRSMRRDVYRACQEVIASCGDARYATPDIQGGITPLIGFSVVLVDTPLDVCLERNMHRKGKSHIPEQIIQKMATSIERPIANTTDYMKKFEVNSIILDVVDAHCFNSPKGLLEINRDKMYQCLQRAIDNPVKELSREVERDPEALQGEKDATKKNRIHLIDRLLRALVGAVGRADKSKGRVANDARKQILQHFRENETGYELDNKDTVHKDAKRLFIAYLGISNTAEHRDKEILSAIDVAYAQATTNLLV